MPKRTQSVSEKLGELRTEKGRIMELLRQKSEGVNKNWIKQLAAEGEEKERLVQETVERHRKLEDNKEYQKLEEKRQQLFYDIIYLEKQEMLGVYYFTKSLLLDIENAFVDLPPNDPRIDECIERIEEIQELLKKDEVNLQNQGVTQGDFDNYNK